MEKRPWYLNETLVVAFAVVVYFLFSVGLAFLFAYVWSLVIAEASNPLAETQSQWLNMGLALSLGLGLVFVKRKQQVVYGIIEVALGMAAGWQAGANLNTAATADVLTLLAAIYLVVRGIENVIAGEKTKELAKAERAAVDNSP